MPHSRMNELFELADANDGLLTSKQAREKGIQDSVLVRLAQRGRLVRAARGVYRIAHYPADRFAQYREAVLWVHGKYPGKTGRIFSVTHSKNNNFARRSGPLRNHPLSRPESRN